MRWCSWCGAHLWRARCSCGYDYRRLLGPEESNGFGPAAW